MSRLEFRPRPTRLPPGILRAALPRFAGALSVSGGGGASALQVSGRVLTLNGTPFPIIGDSPYLAITDLTPTEMDTYLNARASQGFNALWVGLTDRTWARNKPNNIDNVPPFTTVDDFATPNETYFARAALFVSKCAALGIHVFLTPTYIGAGAGVSHPPEGWWDVMLSNGQTKCFNFGVYLANRFLAYDNIVWLHGGDATPNDPKPNGPPDNAAVGRAMALGIRSVTTKWLHGYHGGGSTPTSSINYWGTVEAWLAFDGINTYRNSDQVQPMVAASYARATVYPVVNLESRYEGGAEGGTEVLTRQQSYWAVFAGACGTFMGNDPGWHFNALGGLSWTGAAALTSPAATHFTPLKTLLTDRGAWDQSAPAQAAITAGGGSGLTLAVALRQNAGAWLMVYFPTTRAITIDMTTLAPTSVRARWYDPSNGTYSTVSGSPFANTGTRSFTPTGSNSTSTGDWVLVLDQNPFQPANIVDWNFENGQTFAPSHFGTPIPAFNGDSAVTGQSWCARSNWPSGSGSEVSPGWYWYGASDFGGGWDNLTEVWMRMAVKFFHDYTGSGATGQKIMRFYDPSQSRYIGSLGRAHANGADFIFDFGDTGFQPTLSNFPQFGSSGFAYGTWHWVEQRFYRSGSHYATDLYWDGEAAPRHTFTDPATSSGGFAGAYEIFTTINGPFNGPYEFRVDQVGFSSLGRIGLPANAKIGVA